MKAAFTICTNSYWAKAKIATESFLKHHPEYRFYIFLLDKTDATINYSAIHNCDYVEVEAFFPQVQELSLKYNIMELSCAVRPAIFLHMFEKGFTTVLHIDSDTQTYDRFVEVEPLLDTNNIVVTPHFCSPIDDGKYPSEIDFVKFGLYNLGFLAVKKSDETIRFMNWWHSRLMKYCYNRPNESMFTDQLWVNYAPVFFEGVYILKHVGYNVANWNLYERKLERIDNTFLVNKIQRLKFIHFSYFVFNDPGQISSSQNRYTIEELPVLRKIFESYNQSLIDNKHEIVSLLPSIFQEKYERNARDIKERERAHLAKLKNKFKMKLHNMFLKLAMVFNPER
jgi:hypothetical protein